MRLQCPPSGRLTAFISLWFLIGSAAPALASVSSGQAGAAFLDIPVGARPASLGSAYSAMADDAYAPVWNAGGLGFADCTQLAAQHLAYLESVYYEYLGFVHPFQRAGTLGASIQYLGSGAMHGIDAGDSDTGDFTSMYASYNLSYGRMVGSRLGLGVTSRWIQARIKDTSAHAYAGDLGAMYRLNDAWRFGLTIVNLGSALTFNDQADPLPQAIHAGAAYRIDPEWTLMAEGVYPRYALAHVRCGLEYQYSMVSARIGYRTDFPRELSMMAGLSAGFGVRLWGQEIAYAWLPHATLGTTHYLSIVFRTRAPAAPAGVPKKKSRDDSDDESLLDPSEYTRPAIKKQQPADDDYKEMREEGLMEWLSKPVSQ